MGHQLAAVYSPGPGEAETAAFERLVAAVRGRPAVVVSPDATHFAPDLERLAYRLIELKSAGCEVRCADPQTPDLILNGLERLSIRGRLAGHYSRVRRSVLAKASRGEVLGRTPYGYSAGVDGVLAPVPDEAAVVKRIFEWYSRASARAIVDGRARPASPGDRERVGLRQIAQRLNGDGSRTRLGQPWTPVAIANILRNRTYTGQYSRYGVWISGAHEALIERTAFNEAQSILAGRKPVRGPRQAEPFILGGLLRCGMCGQGVFGLTRRRSWKRGDGSVQSEVYRYYECRRRAPRSGAPGPDHPSWRADELEAAVRAVIEIVAPGSVMDAPVRTPEGPRSPAMAVAAAERAFMQSIRAVAAGKAKTESMRPALEALRAARAAAAAPEGPGAAPAGGLRAAVEAVARFLVVHEKAVELGPRPA
jgi:hypothetical protein